MKAVIEHNSQLYLMTPEQATEVLALILKYGTERWVSSYEKDENNKYVNTYIVEPAPNSATDVQLLQIKLVPDEAYGIAKIRYQAKEKK